MTRPEQADEKGPGSKRRSRAPMQLYARRIKQMLSFIDTDGAVKKANMYWSVNGDQGGSDVGLFLPIWLCVACVLVTFDHHRNVEQNRPNTSNMKANKA